MKYTQRHLVDVSGNVPTAATTSDKPHACANRGAAERGAQCHLATEHRLGFHARLINKLVDDAIEVGALQPGAGSKDQLLLRRS